MNDSATVHIDGAARGNPGPAAYAAVISTPGGEVVEEAETLGELTNNVAEYTALVRALERCRSLGLTNLVLHSDSELLVKQMNGQYKVKSADLKSLYDAAQALLIHFDRVTIKHVRREQNKRADELCNLALDGKPRPRGSLPPPAAAKPEEPVELSERCMECLLEAKRAWQAGESLSVMQVWNALREILSLPETI
jgi:ribonuclease HI